jgi:hypothetical protein
MEQSAWVSVPDPGSVLHAHTKSEKGTSKPFLRSNRLGSRCLTQVRCYMLTLNQKKVPQNPPFGAIGLGLGARPRFGVTCHAKSEKGTSKPFLRSSRSGPPTLYAFAILRIQTWISFYVAPLIWGARLLPTALTTMTTRGAGCCPPCRLIASSVQGLDCCPPCRFTASLA